MRYSLDGALLREMILGGAALVEQHKQQINELNVFPVPDGDTGTNMSLTLGAAADALQNSRETSLTKIADLTASATMRGGRGNSGVILSLLFRGFAKSLKGMQECTPAAFADALAAGVEAAYKAVGKPTEGTILTVSRVSAARAQQAAAEGADLEEVLAATVASAEQALAATVHQNPVLEKAGVVDAGGKGWLYVLQAMQTLAAGGVIERADVRVREQADFTEFATEDITFAFDTVYIVRKNEPDVDLTPLRDYLESIGDSLVIGEDDEAFKVHVHTNIPGCALTESQKYGTLEIAKIENMRTQHDELAAGRRVQTADDLDMEEAEHGMAAPKAPAEQGHKPFGIVSVCAGEGLAKLLRELGADNIIEGGQTMNPSTQDILEAIERTPADTVFVFPNNKNIIMAAQQTADLCDKQVVVVPSKTVPQGISALLVFDPDASAEENLDAMTEALGNVDTMQITYAARDSEFDGHDIRAGEYLALYGSALFGSSPNLEELLAALAARLREQGSEFITVYYGADTTAKQAETAAELFRSACPDAEVNLIDGGQPVYYYLISAE